MSEKPKRQRKKKKEESLSSTGSDIPLCSKKLFFFWFSTYLFVSLQQVHTKTNGL
jgi:hypothetical protein